MDIVQLVALAVGILTLIWHQQRSIAALRAEFKADIAALRTELKADIAELKGDIAALRAELKGDIAESRAEAKGDFAESRAEAKGDFAELKGDIAELRLVVIGNGERLARIEGYLGIGMPEEAAATAAGAGVRSGASAPAEA